ncbi:MAG: hypothetical protein JST54_32590 [Deltaproteobacteria bacterium]|nr:hypothetical protein [Deltaproteobacteria bacterium]
MPHASRQLERWASGLACALLLACSHAAPPPPPADPPPNPELEAKARADLGPDPFSVDAGPPPAPVATAPPPVPIAPPPPDPRMADEAAIRSTLKGKDCPAIHAALSAHPAASPSVVRDALSAAERCEEKAKDLHAAKQSAKEQLLACGPDSLARCRSKALALWKKLASQSPKDAALTARAKETAEADTCLAKVEHQVNGDRPLDPCIAQAESVYRREHDELMRQKVVLIRARHAAHKEEASAERLFSEAAELCDAPRCATVRNQALDAYASWAQAQKKLPLVFELRLKQDELASRSQAPEKRSYVRSPRTDSACSAVEADQGPGACRQLERKVTGRWTFHDWSAQLIPGDLPEDLVRRSNEDFNITLQDCFHDEAGRLPPPSPTSGPVSASYKVQWMVTLEGRVDQVHLAPPADDSGPLATCLRQRFVAWRYPRSKGENQHVEQGFTVSAKVR